MIKFKKTINTIYTNYKDNSGRHNRKVNIFYGGFDVV